MFKERLMTVASYDPKQAITLTDSAKKHIEKELSKQPGKTSDAPETDDRVFEFDEKVHIFVPNKDMPLLFGTEIDFVKVGLNSMFQFTNPNVKGECGCGESFTVTEE